MTNNCWPSSDVFRDMRGAAGASPDGRARCIRVALCDEQGQPACAFYQGQEAHLFFEFEALEDLCAPVAGVQIVTRDRFVVFGKDTLQHALDVPPTVKNGTVLRFHEVVELQIAPGDYGLNLALHSVDAPSARDYRSGSAVSPHALQCMMREHCRLSEAAWFTVGPTPQGRLLHHGLANLPGTCHVTLVDSNGMVLYGNGRARASTDHTIFHVTHWKAGSQWIYKILAQCARERIVGAKPDARQFWGQPIQPGKIYPTLYINKHVFDRVQRPPDSKHFVVIRDLRDTLVSGYFSIKFSHPSQAHVNEARTALCDRSMDDGMIYLMDTWLKQCAEIQRSWHEAGERLTRYEDLLDNDMELLREVLIERCQIGVEEQVLREAVLANRFERLTQGRQRGEEDHCAHERKGVAGDWRNHFTDAVKDAFKQRFGQLLISTGYEKDLNW